MRKREWTKKNYKAKKAMENTNCQRKRIKEKRVGSFSAVEGLEKQKQKEKWNLKKHTKQKEHKST